LRRLAFFKALGFVPARAMAASSTRASASTGSTISATLPKARLRALSRFFQRGVDAQ
jgi:hypothetical protein